MGSSSPHHPCLPKHDWNALLCNRAGSCSASTLNCTNPNIDSVPDSVPPALPLLAPVIVVPAGQPIPPPPVIAATDNNPCFNTCATLRPRPIQQALKCQCMAHSSSLRLSSLRHCRDLGIEFWPLTGRAVLLCRSTVAITTTVAAAPAGRRMLKQVQTNYTRTFTTNKDTSGNFTVFTQVRGRQLLPAA